jgi:hypothetical protein
MLLSSIFYVNCYGAAPASIEVSEETVGACSSTGSLRTLFDEEVYTCTSKVFGDGRLIYISRGNSGKLSADAASTSSKEEAGSHSPTDSPETPLDDFWENDQCSPISPEDMERLLAEAALISSEEEARLRSSIPSIGTLFGEDVYLYNNEILGDDRFAPISLEDRERFWTEKCRLYASDARAGEFRQAFEEVCDNPVGCRLIKEIMAFLGMPFFRNIKIDFCYDVKDDTCILGPLDEVGEGSLRAQFKKAWHRGTANEIRKYGFQQLSQLFEENPEKCCPLPAIWTDMDCANVIPANEPSECPIAKFVVSLIPQRPFPLQGLAAINPDGTLQLGYKWPSLDEKLFHELNHVREFLTYIHKLLDPSAGVNYGWNMYNRSILSAVYMAENTLRGKELLDENLQSLEMEVCVCKEIFECPTLKNIDKKFPFDLTANPTLAYLFHYSDIEIHCMLGLMSSDGKIVWDPINEASYVYEQAKTQGKPYYFTPTHCFILEGIDGFTATAEGYPLIGNFRHMALSEIWLFLRRIMPPLPLKEEYPPSS